MAKRSLIAGVVSAALPIASCSAQISDRDKGGTTTVQALELCNGCPEFVRVPEPPGSMRPIKYVSKYELTWNNYLKSVDAGACKAPGPYIGMSALDPADIRDHLDRFRLDWPISQLTPDDIKCFAGWLQGKTHYVVDLPSGQEWEWFARAGHVDAKFPWGNSEDPGHEALAGTVIDLEQEKPLPYNLGGKYISGAKVGLFPPNSWGLYDILGNVREITSDEISGDVWLRDHPDDLIARSTPTVPRILVKGTSRGDRDWAKEGISANRYVFVSEGHLSSAVGVRFILIGGN